MRPGFPGGGRLRILELSGGVRAGWCFNNFNNCGFNTTGCLNNCGLYTTGCANNCGFVTTGCLNNCGVYTVGCANNCGIYTTGCANNCGFVTTGCLNNCGIYTAGCANNCGGVYTTACNGCYSYNTCANGCGNTLLANCANSCGYVVTGCFNNCAGFSVGCVNCVNGAVGCANGSNCGTGTYWNGAVCISQGTNCAAGTVWNGTSCISQTATACTGGLIWNGSACVASTTSCTAGQVFNGSSCVPSASGVGTCPGSAGCGNLLLERGNHLHSDGTACYDGNLQRCGDYRGEHNQHDTGDHNDTGNHNHTRGHSDPSSGSGINSADYLLCWWRHGCKRIPMPASVPQRADPPAQRPVSERHGQPEQFEWSSGDLQGGLEYRGGAGRADGQRGANGPMYTWQLGDTVYQTIANGTAVKAGVGYWAYFTSDSTNTVPLTTSGTINVQLPAGVPILIGNPGSTDAALSGADSVSAFDPTSNNYNAVTTLKPGQGGWAISSAGGSVTISNASS